MFAEWVTRPIIRTILYLSEGLVREIIAMIPKANISYARADI